MNDRWTESVAASVRALLPGRAWPRWTPFYVVHKSAAVNLYHCCVHKTASQWVKAILADERTFRHCGRRTYSYQGKLPGRHDPRPLNRRTFDKAFPRQTIVSPLYLSYENFAAMPKPPAYRAFFVMRDPRDLVVSWYFSHRYSHVSIGNVTTRRAELRELSEEDGLVYSIRHLREVGLFDALRSWAEQGGDDPNVLVLRYEELTGPDQDAHWARLFAHCDIALPDEARRAVLHDHRFERKSGRTKGKEDRRSHYRKGKANAWREHFSAPVAEAFAEAAGDLVMALGYEVGAA